MTLQDRVATALDEILPVQRESDGAVIVAHDHTVASIQVVTVADGLELVSLNQMLAWDLPLDSEIRVAVAEHAGNTQLGTVLLLAKDSMQTADVLLRYNFPAAGLTDDALRTLLLMVLSTGADVRRALVP